MRYEAVEHIVAASARINVAIGVCRDRSCVLGYPKAKIRPNEDGKVYNFVHPGRKPDNPGYLKSEAVAYPSELAP